MKTVRWLVCLVSLLLSGSAAWGQETATLAGRVAAATGVGLSGATVTVRILEAGTERQVSTDADGSYVLAGLLVPGPYEVRAELAGFTTVVRPSVALLPNQRTTVNFTLSPSTQETLVVVGQVSALERDRATVQQTVGDRLVHTLPLIGRDFMAATSLAAGFTGDPNHPSPQGQFYWSNNVLIDWASHFSKWRGAARTFYSGYGLEAIKEVQVLTSQFSAEYGDALATVTSAVTNSGTNEFHGSGLVFLQDSHLGQRPAFAESKPPSNSQRYGFTLGGPIAKDQTHFFTSFEGWRSRARNIVVAPPALGQTAADNEDEQLLFAKGDHRVGDQHLVTLRYNGQWFRWHNEPGGLSLPGVGTRYQNDVHTLFLSSGGVVGGDKLHEVRLQFARYTDVRRDLQSTPYAFRAGYSISGGAIGPYGFGADPEDTWEGADTLSWRRDAHTLKTGGGFKYVRSRNVALPYGGGAYFFAGSPSAAPQPYAFIQRVVSNPDTVQAEPRSLAGFLFVQDDWEAAPRLTVKLGARYDIERVSHVRGYDVPADKNNLQPRLGMAWQPFDDPLVVRAGAGLYTQQQLLYFINKVQLEGPDGAAWLALSPASPLMPTYPDVLTSVPPTLPPRDIQVVDPSFRNPYSFQASVGGQRELRGLLVTADLIYLNGRDLMSLVDINAPVSNSKPSTRTVAQADATRPTLPVEGGYRRVVSLGNLGRSWYRALQLKVDRSTEQFQAMASYSWARAEDQANAILPEDSRNLDGERGRADSDVRHNLVLGLTWQLPGEGRWLTGWSVSGIGQFRSNRPYTVFWGDDRNGTTQNDARPAGRNTARTDPFRNLDLAVSRDVKVARRDIQLRAEVFNFFGATNYDEYVGTLSSPMFGRPVSAFPMRRVQLAVVARF